MLHHSTKYMNTLWMGAIIMGLSYGFFLKTPTESWSFISGQVLLGILGLLREHYVKNTKELLSSTDPEQPEIDNSKTPPDMVVIKKRHRAMMNTLMARQEIGELTDEDFDAVKTLSLIEMLEANKLMTGYAEGSSRFVTTSPESVAELYLRLRDPDFLKAYELVGFCQRMDDAFPNTHNGHGILIDADGHYSLLQLDCNGDGAEETLATLRSPHAVRDEVNAQLGQAEERG